ncbi:MAG: hypothetical protein ACSHYA_12430 [Opitutaceae bacterium]
MKFTPAGEIIGKDHKVRTVVISHDPYLPDGEYTFLDQYCTDKTCDCRKVIIHVFHNQTFVSAVDYGWGSKSYYAKWLRTYKEDPILDELCGLRVCRTGV